MKCDFFVYFAFYSGMQFSTKDQGNDMRGGQCAVLYKGDGGTRIVIWPTSTVITMADSMPLMLMG